MSQRDSSWHLPKSGSARQVGDLRPQNSGPWGGTHWKGWGRGWQSVVTGCVVQGGDRKLRGQTVPSTTQNHKAVVGTGCSGETSRDRRPGPTFPRAGSLPGPGLPGPGQHAAHLSSARNPARFPGTADEAAGHGAGCQGHTAGRWACTSSAQPGNRRPVWWAR